MMTGPDAGDGRGAEGSRGRPGARGRGGWAGPPDEPPDTRAAAPAGDPPLRRWIASVLLAALVVVAAGAALWWFSPTLTRWLDGRYPDVLFHAKTDRRAVALTIDDAPSPATSEILDVLARHDVRATFFVLGRRVSGHEQVLRRLVEEGHALGNHMMEDRPTWRLHPDELAVRMEEAGSLLARFDTVRWFRPGGGWFDDDIVAAAGASGYRVALGSIYPFDVWLPWPGLLAAFIRRKARPGDVIVLHDGPVRGRRTRKVLERALPALRERGLELVTLGELTAAGRRPGPRDDGER